MIGAFLGALLLAGQARGPVQRVPGWASHGPDGGRVPVLASSADGASVYAGTGAGLFKSEDAGSSWRPVGLPRYVRSGISWVAVAPSDPRVVYAREDSATVHGQFSAFFRSNDAGETWRSLSELDDSFFGLFSLALDAQDSAILYEAYLGTALKSTDGGSSWSTILSPAYSIVVDPTTSTTVYANQIGEDQLNHLQRSLDGGETWSPTGVASSGQWVAVDPLDSRILYGLGLGFQRSDDGGATVSPDTTSPGQISLLAFGGGAPRRLYGAVGSFLYMSRDRGATWSALPKPPGGLQGLTVTAVSDDQDRLLAGGGERGIFESTDEGATWAARNAGLEAADIRAIAVFPPTAESPMPSARVSRGRRTEAPRGRSIPSLPSRATAASPWIRAIRTRSTRRTRRPASGGARMGV